jgi:hypothetical protein
MSKPSRKKRREAVGRKKRREAVDPSRVELWDIDATRNFFGGTRPLAPSTIYRGIKKGLFPKPVTVGFGSARWIADECRGALKSLMAEREGAQIENLAAELNAEAVTP